MPLNSNKVKNLIQYISDLGRIKAKVIGHPRTIHGGACYAFSDCMLDMKLQYCLYRLFHLWKEVQYDRYADRLCLSQASHYTSNNVPSGVSIALGSALPYNFH